MQKQQLYLLVTVFSTFLFGGSKIAYDAEVLQTEEKTAYCKFLDLILDEELQPESYLET